VFHFFRGDRPRKLAFAGLYAAIFGIFPRDYHSLPSNVTHPLHCFPQLNRMHHLADITATQTCLVGSQLLPSDSVCRSNRVMCDKLQQGVRCEFWTWDGVGLCLRPWQSLCGSRHQAPPLHMSSVQTDITVPHHVPRGIDVYHILNS
jgi:hypothetical protein